MQVEIFGIPLGQSKNGAFRHTTHFQGDLSRSSGAAAIFSPGLQRLGKSPPEIAVAGAGKRTLDSLDDDHRTFNNDRGRYAQQRNWSAADSGRCCTTVGAPTNCAPRALGPLGLGHRHSLNVDK